MHAIDQVRHSIRIRAAVDAVAQVEYVRGGRPSLVENRIDRVVQLSHGREEGGRIEVALHDRVWPEALDGARER